MNEPTIKTLTISEQVEERVFKRKSRHLCWATNSKKCNDIDQPRFDDGSKFHEGDRFAFRVYRGNGHFTYRFETTFVIGEVYGNLGDGWIDISFRKKRVSNVRKNVNSTK